MVKSKTSKADEEDEVLITTVTKPQYKCGFNALLECHNKIKDELNDKHMILWRKTPFRLLLDAVDDGRVNSPSRLRGQIYKNLIKTYKREKGGFKIGSQYYIPTLCDVQLIFGVDDGTEDIIDPDVHGRAGSKFGARLFGHALRVSSNMIKEKLEKSLKLTDTRSIEDTVKLLLLLLFQSMFFTNTGFFVGWGYLHYLDDLTRVNHYNWPAHILAELHKLLDGTWDHPCKINGCTVFLLYWVCEHCTLMKSIVEVDRGDKSNTRSGKQELSRKWISSITKWKIESVARVVTTANMKMMDKKFFKGSELRPALAKLSWLKYLGLKGGRENLYVMKTRMRMICWHDK